MKNFVVAVVSIASLGAASFAQSTFEVTGTPVPVTLLKQNYGKTPKGITAYDLSICNSSSAKQSVVSSEIYQALSKSNPAIQPIGRQIVLASILRTQNWSVLRILNIALNSASGVLMVLSSSKNGGPGQLLAAVALGSVSAQQLTWARTRTRQPISWRSSTRRFWSRLLYWTVGHALNGPYSLPGKVQRLNPQA